MASNTESICLLAICGSENVFQKCLVPPRRGGMKKMRIMRGVEHGDGFLFLIFLQGWFWTHITEQLCEGITMLF